MADKQSEEKRNALRAAGAEVVICPTNVEPEDPRSYYEVAKRLVKETPNSFYANQYHNPANPEAHYLTTGPEIWNQCGAELDALVLSLGTAVPRLKTKASSSAPHWFQISGPVVR